MKDRVVLITGASSGLGRAAGRLFVDEGARIGGLDIEEGQLGEAMQEMRQRGGQAMALVADVSKPDQVEGAIGQLVAAWGRLDVVFANAGINGLWAPLDQISPDDWRRTIDVNLTGTYLTVHYALPYLKERGGSVIITSSVNGTRMFSNSGASAYAASKAGQAAFAKMLALELARFGIRVNVICPGHIATEIADYTERQDLEGAGWPVRYPQGKVPLTGGGPGKPEDVAELIRFLASDAARHITGTEVWIDGAESLLRG